MSPLLQAADLFFFILHTGVVAFNLLGWMHPRTRRANLSLLLLTAFSWFGLGIFYGLGYCPLTDWHWEVRLAMGDEDLPRSYVKFMLDSLTGWDFDAGFADGLTFGAFFMALLASLHANLRGRVW